MGKKKKKALQNSDEDDDLSTDEETSHKELSSDNSSPKCPHVGKGVHMTNLKKALKPAWLKVGQCTACVKEKRGATAGTTKNAESCSSNTQVWMCLKCGNQGCGAASPEAGHAKGHYVTPRSDLHCIFVNVTSTTWTLFCMECKSELYIDSYKKLREAVEHAKKMAESKPVVSKTSVVAAKRPLMSSPSTTTFNQTVAVKVQKARGLNNIGNTCFFNAVMQCLSQTHLLTQVLDQHCQKGAHFSTPSINLPSLASNSDSGVSSETSLTSSEDVISIEPLSLQLLEAGPVTLALAALLKEMHSVGKTGAVNPGHLFGQLVRRSPQFRGFQQQDAHELLRHLMDSLRVEEIKRQKSAVLKQFGLSEKTDPKTVSQMVRRKLQAFGRFTSYTLVDKIFGGQLVSTIVCEHCHNSSQMYEPFLDISLPLVEEKPQRPGKNGGKSADDDNEVDISCFGKKKAENEKKLSNKAARAQAKKLKKMQQRKGGGKKASFEETDAQGDKRENDEENMHGSTGEEGKMQKELEENEKNELKSQDMNDDIKVSHEESVESHLENGERLDDASPKKPEKPEKLIISNKFKALDEACSTKPSKRTLDGDEEDDEEDENEANDDYSWEWDYDDGKAKKTEENDGTDDNNSDYIEVDLDEKDPEVEQWDKTEAPKVSLNPLPLESLAIRSSEERDKSAIESVNDNDDDDEEEEEESSNHGDIEDNLEEAAIKPENVSFNLKLDESDLLKSMKPISHDPDRLDPHMEQLCRQVRKLSINHADLELDQPDQHTTEYDISNDDVLDEEKCKTRLQSDWIARSLTSIAPRYHANAGECSIYSCLTNFTAPELLTGQNKWACAKCTRLHMEKSPESSDSNDKSKPQTIYSNASKQLLIFCPPAVLTIHLKRFQQTMFSLKKVNKHVQFPITLDLAPFCSSTSLSMPNVKAGTSQLLYSLFGVVEHSGRLQGGHYTAFVKIRPLSANIDQTKFYAPPTAKTEEVHSLLAEIQKKILSVQNSLESPVSEEDEGSGAVVSKWYYISDSMVTEVTEERVLKCQAYLLFYERIR